MRLNRPLLLISVVLLPIVAYEACFRSWCLYRHWRVRAAGGAVRVHWGLEAGSRPAIFDNPATAGCYVFLNGANVDDRNLAVVDCYDCLNLLDLSNTKISSSGLASLPNMRVFKLRLQRDCLGDATSIFSKTSATLGGFTWPTRA